MEAVATSDFYGFTDLLSEAERSALSRLRGLLQEYVRPVLDEYWERGEFPEQIVAPLVDAQLMEPAEVLQAGERPTGLYSGFRNFELGRMDASVATFYNAQSGLFRTTVNLGGSPEQVAQLEPQITSFAYKGVFALTEPAHGSDIAGGLATSAKREQRDGEDGWRFSPATRLTPRSSASWCQRMRRA